MDNENLSVTEAKQTIEGLQNTQQEMFSQFKPPIWLSLLMSVSFGAIFFGYGMMEHENNWALLMWVAVPVFFALTALYMFYFKMAGIKVNCIPRTPGGGKMNLYTAIVFTLLLLASRFLREQYAVEFAPLLCAVIAAAIFYYLQRKYPTGEVEVQSE